MAAVTHATTPTRMFFHLANIDVGLSARPSKTPATTPAHTAPTTRAKGTNNFIIGCAHSHCVAGFSVTNNFLAAPAAALVAVSFSPRASPTTDSRTIL